MLWRVITGTLIPLVLLPGMCLAHPRTGDASGRDRAPHFHLRFFYALWQTLPDDRSYCRRHRSNGDPTDSHFAKPTPDHDYDAVYLPLSVIQGWRCEPLQVLLIDTATMLDLVQAETVDLLRSKLCLTPAQRLLSPFPHCQPCPIYLRSLSLVI
jgi:hypothetical protein